MTKELTGWSSRNKLIPALIPVALWGALWATPASAYVLPLPADLAQEVLSESVPTAFAPVDWTVADFSLEQDGALPFPPELEFSSGFEERSLEWVRAGEVLVIPRARVILRARGITAGRATNAGFNQPFEIRNGDGQAALPVALVSGKENPVEVVVRKGEKEFRTRLLIRFKPHSGTGAGQTIVDSSCSKFGVQALSLGIPAAGHDEWAYLGCRLVQTESTRHRTSSLEMLLFWDNVGQEVEIGGIRTRSSAPSLWALRLPAEASQVAVKAGRTLDIEYHVPQEFHRGAISLGLGPYSFFFRNSSEEWANWTVMPTFYASYTFTETLRLVAFDATSLNRQFISDLGIYVNSEYIRTLDRRFALNLMLGVHFIGFKDQQYFFKVGAPQGVEMVFTDLIKAGHNLTLGGFVYPEIQGRYYYNTWLRWGTGALFGEINYINWAEKIDEREFSSRSVGFTLGFPLPFLRFL